MLSNTGVVCPVVNRLGMPVNWNDGNSLLPNDFGSPWAFDNANILDFARMGAADEEKGDKQVTHTPSLKYAGGLYKPL